MSETDATAPPPGPRWQVEQVLALAPAPGSVAAAQPLAVPDRWTGLGCDDIGVWGRCAGGASEPYECMADHVTVAFRCTCPSRRLPCKHALALLLLWARGQVPKGAPQGNARPWLNGRRSLLDAPAAVVAGPEPVTAAEPSPDVPGPGVAGVPEPVPPPDPSATRDDRVARMKAGLLELDRWLDDRVRTGLADPALTRYATWDHVAARLVDAQVGGLSNRIRRLAGQIGATPDWHDHVLAEIGLLHLLAVAGGRFLELPPATADSVATALGWQLRKAEVLAGVPHTDDWVVMGRSDTREDRIEVRRIYLRGRATGEWAMVLSFAAYQQRLDETMPVGTTVVGDVFRYPGASGLRCLVGRRDEAAEQRLTLGVPEPRGATTVAAACDEIGEAVLAEPWIERWPVCVRASIARHGGRWVLADHTGSLPLVAAGSGVAMLLACSAGAQVPVTAEWTPRGLVPLTVHLDDRMVDIGPTADPSFVGAA